MSHPGGSRAVVRMGFLGGTLNATSRPRSVLCTDAGARQSVRNPTFRIQN